MISSRSTLHTNLVFLTKLVVRMQSDQLNLIQAGGLAEPGEPESRRGFNMERVDDKIFIWNGFSTKPGQHPKIHRESEQHTMHVYDITRHLWSSPETHGDSIVSCTGSGVCTVDLNIYVFGGFSSFDFYNTLASFDTVSFTWKEIKGKGQIPWPRDKMSIFLHENHLYVFGGWSFQIPDLQKGAAFDQDLNGWGAGWNNEFYKYNITTNNWSYVDTVGRVPEPRAATAIVKIDSDRALLFGGRTQMMRTNDMYIFHLATNTWEFLITPSVTPDVPWPCERSLFSAHLVSDPSFPNPQVFGFWGMDKNSEAINDYWIFDSLSKEWRSIGHSIINLTKPRLWSRSCSFFNTRTKTAQIFVFGGCIGPLTGPEARNSEDQPGMIQFEYGLKRLETLCIKSIVNRFTLFSEILSEKLPPKLVQMIVAALPKYTL